MKTFNKITFFLILLCTLGFYNCAQSDIDSYDSEHVSSEGENDLSLSYASEWNGH